MMPPQYRLIIKILEKSRVFNYEMFLRDKKSVKCYCKNNSQAA